MHCYESDGSGPFLHRCLTVAKCKLFGDSGSIADDHFRQGYQLVMGLKAYGIAFGIVVFWLEHSKAMAEYFQLNDWSIPLSVYNTSFGVLEVLVYARKLYVVISALLGTVSSYS